MSSSKVRSIQGWQALRWAVLLRDKFQCQYCGQRAPNVILEVDHVVAVMDGGTDELENLKAACWACNRGKATLWALEERLRKQKETGRAVVPYRHSFLPDGVPRFADVLKRLLTSEPQTVKNLAEALNRDRAVVRMTLNRLVKRGIVQRVGKGWASVTNPQ